MNIDRGELHINLGASEAAVNDFNEVVVINPGDAVTYGRATSAITSRR
ncbi:MAG TPA: hypothetical protein VIM99_04435 [Blastocatellia bacterium]